MSGCGEGTRRACRAHMARPRLRRLGTEDTMVSALWRQVSMLFLSKEQDFDIHSGQNAKGTLTKPLWYVAAVLIRLVVGHLSQGEY